MKASFTLAAVGASIAAAQSLDSLPECGRTCINNMISIASSQLGCSEGDVTCYCTEPDFGYGVRDCANEACPNDSDANTVISFGTSYCANALQSYTSTASGGETPTNSAGSILAGAGGATATSTAGGDSDSDSDSDEDSDASGSATATSALVGVVTTDGSTLTTTTGSTTLYGGAVGSATSGAASVTSGAGSAAASASGAAGSAASSATDGANSAASSATDGANSAAESATDAAGSATSEAGAEATGGNGGDEEGGDQGGNGGDQEGGEEQSGNAAPVQTAAPVLLGAAALAIFAL